MWRFKMCPRCRGDIFLDQERGKWYEQCLQCGYERELESIVELKKQLAKVRRSERELAKRSSITRKETPKNSKGNRN